MSVCTNCNHENPEGTRFCEECGTELKTAVFCTNCGAENSGDVAFCENCGTPIGDSQKTAAAGEKKQLSKKWLLFGGIGAAAVVVIGILIGLLAGKGGGKQNYALYIKDQEIFYSNLAQNGAWQVTTRFDNDDVWDDEVFGRYGAANIGHYTIISKDGKTIFFPDRAGSDGFKLYYRQVGNEKAESTKIDSDIQMYSVNSAATLVTYLKGYPDPDLYQFNVKTGEKEKIGQEVSDYIVSEDGKRVVFTNEDDDVYFKADKKDKVKLASEIDRLCSVIDCETIYYLKDGALYKQPVNGEKEKIASDASSVVRVYKSGEVYYLTEESGENKLADYIDDDMKASDAKITYPDRPESPSRPYSWRYDTTEEYEAAMAQYQTEKEQYDRDYAAYEEARDAYYAKSNRDDWRESLKDWTMSEKKQSLYFFDGKETKLITDAFATTKAAAVDTPMLVYTSYNQSTFEKVKMSEITSLYDVESMVRTALYSSAEVYVDAKGSSNLINQENARLFYLDAAGKTLFFTDNVDEDCGDLYRVAIENGKPQQAELYDSDVLAEYNSSIVYYDDGTLIYYKDVNDKDVGDLYCNKTLVDSEVNTYSSYSSYNEDNGMLIYYTDWSSDKNKGTLKTWQNGKSVKVNDDVHDYVLAPSGDIVYLYDYSTKSWSGDLYLFKNKKSTKIDTEVTALIPITDSDYRYYY